MSPELLEKLDDISVTYKLLEEQETDTQASEHYLNLLCEEAGEVLDLTVTDEEFNNVMKYLNKNAPILGEAISTMARRRKAKRMQKHFDKLPGPLLKKLEEMKEKYNEIESLPQGAERDEARTVLFAKFPVCINYLKSQKQFDLMMIYFHLHAPLFYQALQSQIETGNFKINLTTATGKKTVTILRQEQINQRKKKGNQ